MLGRDGETKPGAILVGLVIALLLGLMLGVYCGDQFPIPGTQIEQPGER